MSTNSKTLVTYETVAGACQALDAAGQRPSVRAIIATLGGGSPNVVLEYQRQWKAGRPVIKAAEIQVDPRIGQIVGEQIAAAVAAARADIEAQLGEAEQDAEAIGKAGREAEERAVTLGDELEAAKGQLQAFTGQIAQLQQDAEQVKAAAAEQVKTAEDRATAAIAKAEDDAERERLAREAAQVALAKAELRLEALPRLEAEAIRLHSALDAERTARTDAERRAASAEAKAEGEAARLADLQAIMLRMSNDAAAEAGRFEGVIVRLEKRLEAAEEAATLARMKAATAEQELAYTKQRGNKTEAGDTPAAPKAKGKQS